MSNDKVEVRYIGPHDSVDLEVDGEFVAVEQEATVAVSPELADSLLEQESSWRAAADDWTRPQEWDPPAAPADTGPFPGYDDLNVEDVVERLADLSPDELAAVKAYEAAHKNRKGVLEFEAPSE